MDLALVFDLAERHSAACLLSRDRPLEPLWEDVLDVGPKDALWPRKSILLEVFVADAVNELTNAQILSHANHVCYIEDIHPFAVNPKPALRLQGSLMTRLADHGLEWQFVSPSRWQKELGYKKKKGASSKGWAKEKATELGYVLPAGSSGKALQDYRDAFLMAWWALDLHKEQPA